MRRLGFIRAHPLNPWSKKSFRVWLRLCRAMTLRASLWPEKACGLSHESSRRSFAGKVAWRGKHPNPMCLLRLLWLFSPRVRFQTQESLQPKTLKRGAQRPRRARRRVCLENPSAASRARRPWSCSAPRRHWLLRPRAWWSPVGPDPGLSFPIRRPSASCPCTRPGGA